MVINKNENQKMVMFIPFYSFERLKNRLEVIYFLSMKCYFSTFSEKTDKK